MANLPSEIIFNIMSRLPVRSLARFRFVSKLWCNYIDDPHLKSIDHGQQYYPEEFEIMIARTNFTEHPLISLYAIESKQPTKSVSTRVFKVKQIQSLEFKCTRSSEFNLPYIQGSCNGLVYLSQDYWMVRPGDLSVVSPLRKEYYELPPMDHSLEWYHFALHGLGFDDSTNTFKMVWLFGITEPDYACAMVHVFGTKSWRKITQVPSNPVLFTRPGNFNKAIFACGCLHWLAGNGKIIRLDMRTEEFGLINLPNIQGHGRERVRMCNGLVDLHGEVGYVYCRVLSSLEVWVLKQREWVIYCRFDHKLPLPAYDTIAVLGRWNRDGDIFLETITNGVGGTQLFVYYRKSGFLKEVKLIRKSDDFCFSNTFIYPSSMYSIHGIKAYSIKN